MTQPTLFTTAPTFDGPDLEPADHLRLGAQLADVLSVMRDGRWRTLREIAALTGAPEASVSARLRDARKGKFGAWVVSKRRVGVGGLYAYRVTA